MKKLITLSVLISLSFFYLKAQGQSISNLKQLQLKPSNLDYPIQKANQKTHKASGDTIFYDDFGSGGPLGSNLPFGWVRTNNAGNSNDWIWSTSAPGGQYSTAIPALSSPTSSNGFLSLPADAYNTPAPVGGFIGMDASIEIGPINLYANFPNRTTPFPAVDLSFYQFHRYCCVATGDLVVEVSSDGVNYDTYDATAGRNPNSATANGEFFKINVSQTLAIFDTAYIRFRMTGSSHYFWMIDDLALIEGDTSDIQLNTASVNFLDTFNFNPVYTIIPQSLMPPLSFEGEIVNNAINPQVGAYLEVEINHDSSLTSSTGQGFRWSDTAQVPFPLSAASRYTPEVDGYVSTIAGHFKAKFMAKSSTLTQASPGGTYEYNFTVGDSIYARDRGESFFQGSTGPGNYVGGGKDGDRWAVLYSMPDSARITSVMAYIANRAENDGVQIVPKVWELDTSANPLNGPLILVAQGLVPTTITNSMLGSWVKFDFLFGTGPVMLQAGKQYAIGFEQVGGESNGKEMYFGRDVSMEPIAPPVTNYVYVNNSNPGWGWITRVAAIRGVFNGLTVGNTEKSTAQSDFTISPNPTKGILNLNLSNTNLADYTLSIYSAEGKLVLNQRSPSPRIDLKDFEKGIYFIRLQNDENRYVRKVILK